MHSESEGMEKDIPCKRKSKEAGVAILISDQIDFKTKTITRDKEGHYIMIKGSIQEEDITIVNIYIPNIGAPQYIRQILTVIKGEIWASLVVQWLRVCLLMQGTWVRALIWEDPTCRGATGPVSRNY